MIEFIESIMCFESLLQVWNLITENPIWILALLGVAVFFGFCKRKKINTWKVDIKSGKDRIRIKSSCSR